MIYFVLRDFVELYRLLAMPKYYAVRNGRSRGIYMTWDECRNQVNGFSGARYKSFSNQKDAEEFLNGHDCHQNPRQNLRQNPRQNPRPQRAHPYQYSLRSTSKPVVYSDGCCYSNGRKNAVGGVGVYWGEKSPYNVSEKLEGYQTNQRAELTAAYKAIEGAVLQGFSSVEVKTDSSYTIKAVTQWMLKWKTNGWKTVEGKDVKNRADLEKLDNICSKIDVKWTHVTAHRGVHGNECADRLAKEGSMK